MHERQGLDLSRDGTEAVVLQIKSGQVGQAGKRGRDCHQEIAVEMQPTQRLQIGCRLEQEVTPHPCC